MTEREVCKLLATIRVLALIPSPFSDDSDVDIRLCLALGEIAGVAAKALAVVKGPKR